MLLLSSVDRQESQKSVFSVIIKIIIYIISVFIYTPYIC